MTEAVNAKSTGVVTIVAPVGEYIVQDGDPLLSPALQVSNSSLLDYLEYEGASEVHMEKDTFREFTHIVRGGSVEYHNGISRPEFEDIIAEVTANPPIAPVDPAPPAP